LLAVPLGIAIRLFEDLIRRRMLIRNDKGQYLKS
jgi:hypothetical protein